MKKILSIVLASAFCFSPGYGQHVRPTGLVKEGRIVYERKMDMYRRLEDPGMKSMIPQFNVSRAELLFSLDESLWRNIKEEEDIRDQAGEDHDGPVVRMRFGGGDDQTYKDYAAQKMIEQREMGPKKYIIEDSFPHQSWKLEEDTLRVKGYLCKKAVTRTRDGRDVVAWYAEEIQSPSGPEVYGGLPGLILQLDINGGEMVLTAVELTTRGVDKGLVKAPVDGKKITRAAFQKMMDEQFGPGGPGGRATIRIMRN